MFCNQECAQYDGTRLLRSITFNDMISTNSPESQIIADAIEDGWSEREAVVIVKKHLLSLDQPFIARSQFRSVTKRMKPAVSAVQKAKQVSSGPDSPWSKAWHQWTLQLLVRLSCVQLANPHPCYDHTKVTKLSLNQVDCWDEKHREVQVSSAQGRKK